MPRKPGVSRYEVIAIDLAQAIADRLYEEGGILKGRSILAGKYKVSPETIRKAIALLEEHSIVKSVANKGIIIQSTEKAAQYIANKSLGSITNDVEQKLAQLYREKQQIEEEIENVIKTLLVLATLHKQDLHS